MQQQFQHIKKNPHPCEDLDGKYRLLLLTNELQYININTNLNENAMLYGPEYLL